MPVLMDWAFAEAANRSRMMVIVFIGY